MSRILIIQTAFIGDVILTTPLVQALHESDPHAEIDFLTIPASVNIVENNPAICTVYRFDKNGKDRGLSGLSKMARFISRQKYHMCITPHRSLRSAYLTARTNAAMRIGFSTSALTRAFTHIVKYDSEIHEVERNLSLMQPLGDVPPPKAPLVFPDEEDKYFVDELLRRSNGDGHSRLFAVAPGSIWPTKRWPLPYYKEVTRRLAEDGYLVFVLGGPADQPLGHDLDGENDAVISFCGKLTLRQSAYLMQKCAGLLTNDSAPMHLGLAAAIPVFAVFGATVPGIGFAPFGPNAHIFEISDLACRPCGVHGGKKCPVSTFACMETLKPENVYNTIKNEL